MNKMGEVVYNEDGTITVNGYNGERRNFEFIELSEYYSIVKRLEIYVSELEYSLSNIRKDLKKLK